ncbi:Uma2 family endonuclease [Leptolyngbya sp. 7M]|uniref:Uma2 family endonuclease n=1 Tax=Leptolyngbya sp. 7M TaxID=2812896 RepID=UPI001B8CD786|nr:Uma2 family endonuclease [Leptolyngbya sp. 7M]QYO67834.1 Uma2 family endonuclease [Leptolyngbya sp. 7M]
MVLASSSTTLSLEDFLKLPETKPASEYIEGRIYQKPMPQGKHSTLQGRFTGEVNHRGLLHRTVYAFPELRCTFAGRSIVPDISVFTWERIPRNESGEVENTFRTYPDWVIEILSPDQRITRVINNILFCLNNGTSLGWLVDPEEKNVIIFQPGQQPIGREEPDDRLLMLSILEDWQLTVEGLFNWLNLP